MIYKWAFNKDGYLRITDRKKEIFKLSAGKYIAPQMLENRFKESPFIENIMVIGENEKFASALVSPDFNRLQEATCSPYGRWNNFRKLNN